MTNRSLLIVLLVTAGAGACGEGTTGKRVVLQTAAVSELPANHTFVSNLGWTVTITRGAVATGPFYYFEGPPAVVEMAGGTAPSRGVLRRALAWLSPIGTADAHPGHYVPGRAMGQELEPFSVDLMTAAPTTFPEGEGITGMFRSGTFSFAAPTTGPAVDMLGSAVALVEGVAAKGSETVNFRATAELSEVLANAKDGLIVGAPFTETHVEGHGVVTATIHPNIWFTLVNFAGLPPGTPEAPTLLEPGTTPRIAFALGLAQIAAYSFSFTPKPETP
jgi:hypothetical protein